MNWLKISGVLIWALIELFRWMERHKMQTDLTKDFLTNWRRPTVKLTLMSQPLLMIPLFLWGTPTTETTITKDQLKIEIRKSVCANFCRMRYSGKGDTAESLRQMRKHNARLSAYKCSALELDKVC